MFVHTIRRMTLILFVRKCDETTKQQEIQEVELEKIIQNSRPKISVRKSKHEQKKDKDRRAETTLISASKSFRLLPLNIIAFLYLR